MCLERLGERESAPRAVPRKAETRVEVFFSWVYWGGKSRRGTAMPMRSTLMGMLRGQPWPDRPRPRGPIAPSLLIPQHLSAPAVRVQQVHLLTHLVYPDAASTRQREDVAAEATYHNRKHPQLVPAPWNRTRHEHTSPPRPGHFSLVVRVEERHRPPSTGLGGRGIRACGCTCVLLRVAPAGGTSVGNSRLLKRVGDREFLSGLEVCWGGHQLRVR